jgi:hypothetical protein
VPLKRRGPLVERIDFGIVRIYLDDIQEIFSILKEIAHEVRIQADDFVATEPEDLLDISSKTIDQLTIVATQPNATVTLSANSATVEATDADNNTLGALKRIEELMRGRRRRFKRFVWASSGYGWSAAGWGAFAAVLSAVVAAVALFISATSSSSSSTSPSSSSQNEPTFSLGGGWLVGIGIVFTLAIVISPAMIARRQAIVIPRLQKEAPPFWERNKDVIAITAIFTVIGAVLGIAATLLVQSITGR